MTYKLDEVTEQKLPEQQRPNVCVYTICKNEAKHVDRWVRCVYDADLIYILDTGSTDNTVELFRKYPKVKIDTFLQDDFDFSVARNGCYKNAKKYCSSDANWVFVSLDLDEFLEENGIQKIKHYWKSSFDTHILYEDRQGDITYRIHKVHSDGNWVWKNKVHETPVLEDKPNNSLRIANVCSITYIHEQDELKVRPYYALLTKDKQSITTLYNMMWELHDAGRVDECLLLSDKLLYQLEHDESDPRYKCVNAITDTYLSKAYCEYELERYDDATRTLDNFNVWLKSINSSVISRSASGLYAQILFRKKLYRECIRILLDVICASSLWLEQGDVPPWNNNTEIYLLLAKSYSELYDFVNASVYAKEYERGLKNEK